MALKKFCLCFKLRNGVVIFGILCIILNVILLIGTVFSNTLFDRVQNRIFTIYETDGYDVKENDSIHFEWNTTPLFWITVLITITDLLLSILLIVGAVKRNHFLMLPWIIVHGIVMIPFALATAVLLIVGLPIYGPVYIWWCVCSAYQKVQDEPYNKFDSMPFSNNSVLTGEKLS